MKPNLFLAGNPKSGTTAIYEYLDSHPSITMSDPKELHVLDQDTWDATEYVKAFRSYENEYVGEASPTYFHDTQAMNRVKAVNKDAKILVSLRNPASFLVSWHEHQRRRQGDNPLSVDDVFSDEHATFNEEWVAYTEDVQRVLDLFGASNVHVIIYERFKDDNQVVMDEVFSFLGVEPIELDTATYNQSMRCRFDWLDSLIVEYDLGEWLHVLPSQLREPLLSAAKTVLFETPQTDAPTHAHRFKDEILSLQRLLHEHDLTDVDLTRRWPD